MLGVKWSEVKWSEVNFLLLHLGTWGFHEATSEESSIQLLYTYLSKPCLLYHFAPAPSKSSSSTLSLCVPIKAYFSTTMGSFFNVCLIHVISAVWLQLPQVSLVHASIFLLLETMLVQNAIKFSCGTSLSMFADHFDSLCNFPWFSPVMKNIHGFISQNFQLWKWQQDFPNLICSKILVRAIYV